MHFTDVFVRRPVFASALSFMLLAAGIIAFTLMPVRQYPKIETSVVTVTTTYPGANAQLMAGFITTPLENAIGSIDGIDYMTSTNVQNTSRVIVNLQLGYPIETGVVDVANQVSSVSWMLPKEANAPSITKQDPNASPIAYISFDSEDMSSEAVTDFLLRVIQPQFQGLNGVSQAEILGKREYSMRLNLNTARMKAMNVTANDLMSALTSHNLQGATGQVEGEYQVYNVVANTDMATSDQFNDMVIKNTDGYIVRLRDIGDARLGARSYDSSAIMNGKNTTVVGIIPTSDANPLSVSKDVHELMPSIQGQLPSDVTANIVYDSSIFIAASIDEVYVSMAEAIFFVLIVIFLFLGSIRAVIIPIVTIPLSLIGVSTFMYALGYSINTITLLAWVLAIGLVVDDAIVVLENIYRHMEDGLAPIPAAIVGAREIGFAVIAMTITLAAVFAPIGFTGGLTGILFKEFAFTLAGAVIISGFIALTLTPMMCSRLLSYDKNKKTFADKLDAVFDKIMNAYQSLLRHVIKLRWVILLFAFFMWGVAGYLFTTMPQELAPEEDQGVVIAFISGPSSTNIKYTEAFTKMLNPVFQAVPEMASYGIINGFSSVNSAIGFLNLVPWGERDRSAAEISQAIFPKVWSIPGLKIIPLLPPAIPVGSSSFPIQFVIKTADSSTVGLEHLNQAMHALIGAAYQHPGFQAMDSDLKLDKPQVQVTIDRNKAGDLGVSIEEISNALNIMLGAPTNVQFSMQGRGYYVIPAYDQNFNYQSNPEDINTIYVHSKTGDLIPLSNIVTLSNTVEPQSINHFAQLTSATLSASTVPGYPLGDALTFLTNFMGTNFPDLQVDYSGQARQLLESQGAMTQVLVFAIILIFLVLAAQFESYRDPFIILFVVPLTLAAAMLTLQFVGSVSTVSGALSIYSKIALTTLVGLIAKHGILIVEFANQLQLDKGLEPREAVIQSASMRLRPILMTTGAMVLGVLPLAIATGAGAAARNQMGWLIVGGMSIGTVFSLFVVPSLYAIMAKPKHVDETLEQQIQDAIAEQPSSH